jgi:hypothetical protein
MDAIVEKGGPGIAVSAGAVVETSRERARDSRASDGAERGRFPAQARDTGPPPSWPARPWGRVPFF